MPCEGECIAQYNSYNLGHYPSEPYDGAVYAPYVEFRFGVDGNQEIFSVSNQSSPNDPHKTVIKSLSYGHQVAEGGVSIEIELASEGAQAITSVIRGLNKTFNAAQKETLNTNIRFGWIVKKSDNTTKKIETPFLIYALPLEMYTNYDSGTIKVKVALRDPLYRVQETRIEANYGADDNLKYFKEAVEDIFERNSPQIEVEWRGLGTDWFFGRGDKEKGPKGKWTSDQQNALAVVKKWAVTMQTNNNKGFLFQYDAQTAKLVIREAPYGLKKDDKLLCDNNWVATYIVNGGNCSNVLSFSPQVRWNITGAGSGGVTGGDNNAGNAAKSDEQAKKGNIERGGPATTGTIPNNLRDQGVPGKDAARVVGDALAANEKGTKPYTIMGNIEADLTILGDPNYINPIFFVGKHVSIVMLNPLYIKECTWIASPRCNHILSAKNWIIRGVSHHIEAGKYTTTLKVILAVPNSDLQSGDPLGGFGCGTTTFTNDKIGENQKDI